MKRTIGWSDTASRWTGRRGFCSHASRSASLVGGSANSVVESSVIHSQPSSARMRRSVRAGDRLVEERGVPDLDGERGAGRVDRREAPDERGQGAEVGGPNDAGSWTEIVSARAPSGASSSRNARTSSSAPRSRRSWVTVRGSLNRNRKSAGACSAHAATVAGDGSP